MPRGGQYSRAADRMPWRSASPIGRRKTMPRVTTPAGHANDCTKEATNANQLTPRRYFGHGGTVWQPVQKEPVAPGADPLAPLPVGSDLLGVNERQEGECRSFRQVRMLMPGFRGHLRIMQLLPFAAAASWTAEVPEASSALTIHPRRASLLRRLASDTL
jgi:hypothetical protein